MTDREYELLMEVLDRVDQRTVRIEEHVERTNGTVLEHEGRLAALEERPVPATSQTIAEELVKQHRSMWLGWRVGVQLLPALLLLLIAVLYDTGQDIQHLVEYIK